MEVPLRPKQMNAGSNPARSAMQSTFFPPETGGWYILTNASLSGFRTIMWIQIVAIEEDNRPGVGLDYWVKTKQWVNGSSGIIGAGHVQRYWGVLFSVHNIEKLEDEEFQALLALIQ